MSDKICGFSPIYDENSRVLVLGSFPSVKSRKIDFYYGNRQNRFWKMLFSYFGEEMKESNAEKAEFLLRRNVALWDVVAECTIRGSSDATIRASRVADIPRLLAFAPIERILLNGRAAYEIFADAFGDIGVPFFRMPSTSPANPRYEERIWHAALDEVFAGSGRSKNREER